MVEPSEGAEDDRGLANPRELVHRPGLALLAHAAGAGPVRAVFHGQLRLGRYAPDERLDEARSPAREAP